jgi:hypothetical protein
MSNLKIVSLACCSFLISACSTISPPPAGSKAPGVETAVRAATTTGKSGEIRSPVTGKIYRFYQTDDPGAQADTRAARRSETDAALAADDVTVDDSNIFKGHARAQAKTTIAHAKLEKLGTLPALVASIPTDEFMLSYQPRIDRDSPRVAEEVRNVAVCAWIVATKGEDDNDYHIMLSDDDDKIIFNAEMSGIPDTGSKANRKRLFNARSTFEAFVAEDGRKTSNYVGWGDPVLVYVEGSLFYDTEHKPGAVGPAFARPKSAWEIHPISKILFEPTSDLCQ